MGQENHQQESLKKSKVFVELDQLSSKQRNAILGLIKNMGFVKEEIEQVVITLGEPQDKEVRSETEL